MTLLDGDIVQCIWAAYPHAAHLASGCFGIMLRRYGLCSSPRTFSASLSGPFCTHVRHECTPVSYCVAARVVSALCAADGPITQRDQVEHQAATSVHELPQGQRADWAATVLSGNRYSSFPTACLCG